MMRSTAARRTPDDLGAEFLRAIPPSSVPRTQEAVHSTVHRTQLLELEQNGGIADRNQVAVVELMSGDFRSVDEGSVVALKVFEHVLPRPLADLAVLARAVVVARDGDVDLGAPPKNHDVINERDNLGRLT